MKKKKIKLTELKKYLKNKTDKELIDEVVNMFKLSKQVQEFYLLRVNPENEKKLLEEYMDKISDQFFPIRGMNVLNYSVLKKLITDFKKIAITQKSVIELLLCYAENGVDFTNTFGDIDERFYNKLLKVYVEALELIVKNDLEEEYVEKCYTIMSDSMDIGWGFSDDMAEVFYQILGEFLEE